MAEGEITEILVPIGTLADGVIPAAALLALPANDGEGDHYPVALLQLLVVPADLNHFSHELVTHDVA